MQITEAKYEKLLREIKELKDQLNTRVSAGGQMQRLIEVLHAENENLRRDAPGGKK